MLQLLLFGCIVFPLIAAVAVALDKEGTLRRRIVYAGTGITALSALGLALYGSFVLPISPDSSLQPLMTVLDLALLVFILYVAVNIRHRLSMGLALGQLAGMIYLDFFMLEGHQATAFLADPLALVMVLVSHSSAGSCAFSASATCRSMRIISASPNPSSPAFSSSCCCSLAR